jgi:hypothetical protein
MIFFVVYVEEEWLWGKWCFWIAHCISAVHFTVLVTSTPICFFSSSHGLKKGDTLSPFSFVFVMEMLDRMISTAVSEGLLSSFYVGNVGGFVCSHILFVDDTLIFTGDGRGH